MSLEKKNAGNGELGFRFQLLLRRREDEEENGILQFFNFWNSQSS